jgi:hypothetical protein
MRLSKVMRVVTPIHVGNLSASSADEASYFTFKVIVIWILVLVKSYRANRYFDMFLT